ELHTYHCREVVLTFIRLIAEAFDKIQAETKPSCRAYCHELFRFGTITLKPKLLEESTMKNLITFRLVAMIGALLLLSHSIHAQDVAWPQFRGPESNPVGTHARLAEHWSKTENVEWAQEIPGRGWSSPIVT